MTPFLAKLIWYLGVSGWYLIRLPHQLRSRRIPKARRVDRVRDLMLLTISFTGLFIVPVAYVLIGEPSFADYPFRPIQAWIGAAVFGASLLLFQLVHQQLAGNWSVTLEIRKRHTLVTTGLYRHIRHPMYSAFWLWALAQALLLPNWIAGSAGLVGFGTLFFGRLWREERLMTETFGDDYRAYMARTKRIIPGVF
jgi:protein-S-isoprenylcysteine O-methyltransferase Ste14